MLSPLAVEQGAERFCREMARREAKNFYWGFISLPHEQRMAIYALYDFARQVDDDVDSAPRPDLIPQRLAAQRERVRAEAHSPEADPVMYVLSRAVERYAIPESELLALIDGVEQDLTRTRYATWSELREYCTLVASIVGRMCVRIFGFRDPAALERADELGIALQLINIMRDVREDAARGRIYLPLEELDAFDISEDDVLRGRAAPSWPRFVAFQSARARKHYASGLRVTTHIPTSSAVCVRTMAGIYLRILERIEAEPVLPLRHRASLSPAVKLGVMARSWIAAL